jgi:hypothetical protein
MAYLLLKTGKLQGFSFLAIFCWKWNTVKLLCPFYIVKCSKVLTKMKSKENGGLTQPQ